MALTKANNRMIDGAAFNILDYGAVGDGTTDDNAAIQAALTAAGATGTYATVIVPPSPTGDEYIFTNLTVSSKTTFLGTGGVLKFKDNTAVNSGSSYYPIQNFSVSGTEVIYDGLIIEGNSANNTSYTVCDSITCTGEGSIVRNCKILDAVDSGIMFSAATHGQCINNYIKGAKDAGIYVNNSSEVSDDIRGAVISGNIVQDCDYGGINIKRSSGYISVTGNTIEHCGNGFTIEEFGTGSGGEPDHLIIANNIVNDIGGSPFTSLSPTPSQSGCNVQLSTHCVIEGNKFVGVRGSLFGLDGAQYCIVNGNSFIGNVAEATTIQRGIVCSIRDGITPKYNVVSNNIIHSIKNEGIRVEASEYSTFTGNVVQDVDQAGGSAYAFLSQANADNNVITGNVFEGNTLDFANATGAVSNIFTANKLPNGSGVALNGIRRNSAVLTPVGNITPLFAGEFLFITTGSLLFFATGPNDTDWIQLN